MYGYLRKNMKIQTDGDADVCRLLKELSAAGYETVGDQSVYMNAVGLFAYDSGIIMKTDDIDYFVSHPNEQHVSVNGKFVSCKDYFEQPETTYAPLPSDPAPIGLVPKSIHDSNRLRDIVEAMQRFAYANKRIPAEWISELQYLNNLVEDV